jgi:hypothetical protein
MPAGRWQWEQNMTDYLKKYGLTVLKNGWPIVLLPYKSKKPIGFGWQNRVVTSGDVEKAIRSGKQYGLGIKCGNVVGIDDDYEASEVVTDEFLDAVKELKDHYFPKALWRRGRPTREPLRVIRLTGEDTAKSLNVDKLQIIGKGRQFVAYNLHPDTGESYAWTKEGIGSPVSVKFKDIPRYSKKDLEGFLQGMLLLEETFGLAPERAGEVLRQIKAGERPKHVAGLAADRRLVEKACEWIKNDPQWGWEDWNNNIMMPLYNAAKGEEWGRELAHTLSEQHDQYDSTATDERWDQISKHPADSLGWPRLNWLARQQGMPFLGPLDWDNYRVFRDRADVLNITNNFWYLEKRFSDTFHKYKEKHSSVMQTFMDSRPDQVFDTITWNSLLPSGAARDQGKTVWNTWKAPDWFGEAGDITPWLVMMDKVYGDMMDIVIKRMAADVRYPELRPQWHILVTGEHGIGKSDSYYPLMQWAKRFRMHGTITSTIAKSEFNSWLTHKKIITMNEVNNITTAHFNEFKDLLAGSEETHPVNEKKEKRVDESVIASFYFSSNYRNAMAVSKTERRLLIHHSLEPAPHLDPRWKKESYECHDWLKKNWSKVIHYLKYDLRTQVDPSFIDVHPGITAGQIETADMTAPAYERIAENIKELMRNRPVFDMADVQTALATDETSVDPSDIRTPTIRKALSYLGAVRLYNGKPIKIMNGSGPVQKRLWSLDRTLLDAGNEQIRQLVYLLGLDDEW